jgi:NADPH2:quinone reductase
VLVRVAAAGVNRPDVTQRLGFYPPPPGASDLPGLDVAGVGEEAAPDVTWPLPGTAVTALVTGGGYAEWCVVPAPQCLPVPRGLDFVAAAGLPEVFFTAWNSMVLRGALAPDEKVLVQGGTSGVGLACLQIARQVIGARAAATCGSATKRDAALAHGAEAVFDYRADWIEEARAWTGGGGFDVILDAQAGPTTEPQLGLLANDGRLVLLATHQGVLSEVNCRFLVRRGLTLTGITLRARPVAHKGRIALALREKVWPLLEAGAIRMPVCATFPLADAAEAHRVLDANAQIGKVVLVVDAALAGAAP